MYKINLWLRQNLFTFISRKNSSWGENNCKSHETEGYLEACNFKNLFGTEEFK